MPSATDERSALRLNFVTVETDDRHGFIRVAWMRRIAGCIAVATVISALGLAPAASDAPGLAAQVAAAPTSQSTATDPGSSYDTAIVLEEAKDEMSGIGAEHSYIAAHFPGWRLKEQLLLNHDDRIYDRIDIIGPTGETKALYFDIADWFGKLD